MSSTVITVKLTPKASKNDIQGWVDGADGQKFLKCNVTTVPEKGKANKALIALLSKHYRIPKSAFTIVKGEADRIKTIEIQGLKNLPDKV